MAQTNEKSPVSDIDLIAEPIQLFKPFHGEEEIEAVSAVLRSGWWGLGPKTMELETTFAAYVGAPKAISVNSATAGLHLAMMVADVTGAEVITTPMTFVSTNHAILFNQATPVFADVEADTLNIDPDDIARKITDKTKAIVVVDYGGHPADLDPILALAEAHNLVVIEDAAHAAGAQYKGRPVGSISPLTTFSFHPVKNIATGDGGMITLNNDAWAERLKRLRWVGINKNTWQRADSEDGSRYNWEYNVEEAGYKYHTNDINSAIALVQLARLQETNARRREICAMYDAGLSDVDWLTLPIEKEYAFSARHNYVIRLAQRDKMADWLRDHRIGSGMHYIPNHLYEMYQPYVREPLPVIEREWLRCLTLPLHPAITDDEVDYMINVIKRFPYA